MRKICVVTGSRAEYGLLKQLMFLIQKDDELKLQIIATNMHLSPEFGSTYKEIEKDGFTISKKVEMLLSSDSPNAGAKSVGIATIGFADAFEDLKPDLIIILGDRFELLSVVSSAIFYKIPIAHLHGGEITEGAFDDAIRHTITKMSHIHFTSTETYRKRVIQLGENPQKVFNVGAIGIDNIKNIKLLSLTELEENLQFKFGNLCVLVTFHPVTLENNTAEKQMNDLLLALESIDDLKIIFTLPNSDTGGRIIIQLIDEFVSRNKNRSIAFKSLGQLRYLSALNYVNAVVGNSSSGIIEVPSFGIPSLNIGDRQLGRIKSDTVVDCKPEYTDICEKLHYILNPTTKNKCKTMLNPYEKEKTAETIFGIIKNCDLDQLVKKIFYNL